MRIKVNMHKSSNNISGVLTTIATFSIANFQTVSIDTKRLKPLIDTKHMKQTITKLQKIL